MYPILLPLQICGRSLNPSNLALMQTTSTTQCLQTLMKIYTPCWFAQPALPCPPPHCSSLDRLVLYTWGRSPETPSLNLFQASALTKCLCASFWCCPFKHQNSCGQRAEADLDPSRGETAEQVETVLKPSESLLPQRFQPPPCQRHARHGSFLLPFFFSSFSLGSGCLFRCLALFQARLDQHKSEIALLRSLEILLGSRGNWGEVKPSFLTDAKYLSFVTHLSAAAKKTWNKPLHVDEEFCTAFLDKETQWMPCFAESSLGLSDGLHTL